MNVLSHCEPEVVRPNTSANAAPPPVGILLLSRYGSLGASSRLRAYQFLPYLRSRGFAISVSPLFDDEYVRRLYSQRLPNAPRVAAGYLRRAAELLRGPAVDLLWLEREAFPFLGAGPELRLLRATGVPFVLELDDAVFHRYGRHRSGVVRRCLGDKIEQLMKNARLVVAGSEYIARHARDAGAEWVEHVPTVVDMERYTVPSSEGTPFTIGWIGTPSTAPYLQAAAAPLRTFLGRHRDARFLVVGAAGVRIEGVSVETADWAEASEPYQVARMDVGIMPLTDGPYENGKCGYKLIQYMAAGKPVIASPVGANRSIVQEGISGFLPGNRGEWCDRLELLYRNADLRRRMGAAGRTRVEREFSLQAVAPRVAKLLRHAAGKPIG